jgi:hypothetical protein
MASWTTPLRDKPRGGDGGARNDLLGDGDGVLEIEDRRVGAGGEDLRELARTITGDEERLRRECMGRGLDCGQS